VQASTSVCHGAPCPVFALLQNRQRAVFYPSYIAAMTSYLLNQLMQTLVHPCLLHISQQSSFLIILPVIDQTRPSLLNSAVGVSLSKPAFTSLMPQIKLTSNPVLLCYKSKTLYITLALTMRHCNETQQRIY
jgi:hypothetical protein